MATTMSEFNTMSEMTNESPQSSEENLVHVQLTTATTEK